MLALLLSLVPAQLAWAGPRDIGEDGSGPPPIPIVYSQENLAKMRAAETITFSDLDSDDLWAKQAIQFVAGTYDWMRDFAPNQDGTYPFRPHAISTRKYFARSLVKAFAPDERPDPETVLADVDPSTAWHKWAAVAVEKGWMTVTPDGEFFPDDPVTMTAVHRALILALGLRPAAKALNQIHTRDGSTFDTGPNFGTTVLGMRLGLRYNSPTGQEERDVLPSEPMPRAQVAYSLFKAKTQPAWTVPEMIRQYENVELPNLGPARTKIVQWGIRYGGYPYVWGGEWGFKVSGQSQPGFDCSGLTWWVVKEASSGYDVVPPRPYRGWRLDQRTSADMARMAPSKIRFDDLAAGDLMFYDGNSDGVVDHVDTYIGHGYAIDSSSTPGGVTIMWVGDGWYRDHFVYGRRVLT
jgi:hypothetical protein